MVIIKKSAIVIMSASRTLVFMAVCSLFCAFVVFPTDQIMAAPESPQVEKIRIGPHPFYTRILINLNRPTVYDIHADYEKKMITLTLDNTLLSKQVRSRVLRDNNLSRIHARQSNGKVLIQLGMRNRNTRLFHFMDLEKSQIVIDLKSDDTPLLRTHVGKGKPAPGLLDGKTSVVAEPRSTRAPAIESEPPPQARKDVRIKGMTKRLLNKILREDIETKLKSGFDEYQIALKMYQYKNYAEAIELFDEYLLNYRDSVYRSHILYLIAEATFQSVFRQANPQYDGALTAFKRALREYPRSSFADHAEYKIGFIYGEMGYTLEAKVIYLKGLKKDPKNRYNAARKIGLATLLINDGQYENAYDAFQSILKDNPKSLEARSAIFIIADQFYKEKRYDRALAIYEEGARRWPNELSDRPEINFSMGDIYFRKKNYPPARKHFFNLINLAPDIPMAHKALNWLGDSYLLEGQALNALNVFEESAKRNPGSRESQYGKIRMADIGVNHPKLKVRDNILDMEPYYRPLETYDKVFDLGKDVDILAEATLSRGTALLREQNYLKAIEEFKKLIPLGQNSKFYGKARKFIQKSLVLLVDQYSQQGGVLPILYSYTDYSNLALGQINNYKTLLQIGEAYQSIGMFPEALRFYDQVKQLDPKGVFQERIFLNLGKIHLERAAFREAELVAKSFLKNHPRSPQTTEAKQLLAKTHSGQKQYKKALIVYRQILKARDANLSEIHYEMGEVYSAMSHQTAAIRSYKHAINFFDRKIRIVPDYVRKSYYLLGISLYNNKNYAKAIPALQSARDLFPDEPYRDLADLMLIESFKALKNQPRMITELKSLTAEKNPDPLVREAAEARLKVIKWEKELKDKL
jgi:TolA-binding protein